LRLHQLSPLTTVVSSTPLVVGLSVVVVVGDGGCGCVVVITESPANVVTSTSKSSKISSGSSFSGFGRGVAADRPARHNIKMCIFIV